ncbi:MAG: hypothetical protein ACT4O1_16070 [Gemmatimonadota bacterium]
MMHSPATPHQSPVTRRRNVYLASALVLFAVSSMFIFGLKGMIWLMWRDAPAVAALLFAGAALFVGLWWRTPRS